MRPGVARSRTCRTYHETSPFPKLNFEGVSQGSGLETIRLKNPLLSSKNKRHKKNVQSL
jgi:hypothetical protein